MLLRNIRLKPLSKSLRARMTESEVFLWSRIKGKQLKGCQFYRQRIIGDYIVDFYCPRAKIVVEVDGGQHFETENMERDADRDRFMERQGLKVLRFSNDDVLRNIDGVLETIWNSL